VHSCIKQLPSHELKHTIKIGTRESQLAVWQATLVQKLLKQNDVASELVFIKSEGDIDTVTPLYELGVQGIFTKSLDAALLNKRIDIAVHSLKDVPTKLAAGIQLAAILERASYKDVLIYKDNPDVVSAELGLANGRWLTLDGQSVMGDSLLFTHHSQMPTHHSPFTIATSSIRRMAQWLNRYPNHLIENLRGNVNTRLSKLKEHNWNGAIFAAAGLERIGLRPQNSLDLDWMLPAPAQGAITIACRQDDAFSFDTCNALNDPNTELCTKVERDFLRALQGGCSTPISALAGIESDAIIFKGNICSPDGRKKIDIEKRIPVSQAIDLGKLAANEIIANNGQEVMETFRKKD
jgi:hydroxymethylbilane synthase